eukprot:9042579-Lingulodinium_polyedra.AAC.1
MAGRRGRERPHTKRTTRAPVAPHASPGSLLGPNAGITSLWKRNWPNALSAPTKCGNTMRRGTTM